VGNTLAEKLRICNINLRNKNLLRNVLLEGLPLTSAVGWSSWLRTPSPGSTSSQVRGRVEQLAADPEPGVDFLSSPRSDLASAVEPRNGNSTVGRPAST
jgi:hypothetical protein